MSEFPSKRCAGKLDVSVPTGKRFTGFRRSPSVFGKNSKALSNPEPLQSAASGALVAASLSGNQVAFSHLFNRYAPRLLNFIHRIIRDRERSEDLVQEAFIRVHRHLHRFDQTRQFSTWLYTIASNLARNELRNRGRTPLVFYQSARENADDGFPALQFEDRHQRPDEVYRRRYLKEAVKRSVEQMTERHREVFVLREMDGRSYEEIAAMTGCTLGTVKSRLNRARRSFATAIEPYLD
jgi:RNA polymerase sigma-70 factor (ECF subfamily)